jgi:hypothetical protein
MMMLLMMQVAVVQFQHQLRLKPKWYILDLTEIRALTKTMAIPTIPVPL